MSSNLYLFFDASNSNDVLPPALQGLAVPGYSFWSDPMRKTVDAPGEPGLPVHCTFYAQNDFRIFIADRAIHFRRGAALPPELARGERHLVAAVLELVQFRLRRWVATEEGWTDDDEPFVSLLREGNDAEGLRVELGVTVSS
jgi:hypothetical protein